MYLLSPTLMPEAWRASGPLLKAVMSACSCSGVTCYRRRTIGAPSVSIMLPEFVLFTSFLPLRGSGEARACTHARTHARTSPQP